jgi:aminobenzoyl-glutamate utilization protein B
MKCSFILAIVTVVAPVVGFGASVETAKEQVIHFINQHNEHYCQVAKQIWDYAEVGYQEEKSSGLLQQQLETSGFSVERGVAGMPTAFVASYGQGRPVVALIAEFDALPGLSQEVETARKAVVEGDPGHGCGHHLFGTAAAAAGISVKEWLEASGTSGTLRVYGTPAEEGGGGKVYMVREGLFDDVDAVLTWHPGDHNNASPRRSLANKSAKFRFYGQSAHAAAHPDQGRSALDGVEAMNYMVNLLREHVSSDSRIHYVITRGGGAPNVVPDFAEVYYYCRHPEVETVQENFSWIVKAAEGAALGTATRMEYEVIHGLYSKLPNRGLQKLLDTNMRELGGVTYSPDEAAFAERIRSTLADPSRPLGSQQEIQPFVPSQGGASTDVGDISWVAPTASVTVATWVPGTPSHSWQAVAAGGMSIGFKGMTLAAKTLATTSIDLFTRPEVVEQAHKELRESRGADFEYRALVGSRKPPLDYRK